MAASSASYLSSALSSTLSYFTSPRNTPSQTPPRGSSSKDPASPAAGATPVRLDWAASSSAEQHVPKLLDAKGNVTHSNVLTQFSLRQLASACPSRFAYSDWRLLYSTAVHGISLNTFFSCGANCGCCMLVIKDAEANVFGGFCTEWREPFNPPTFYGGGETFLFTVERCEGLPPLPGAHACTHTERE